MSLEDNRPSEEWFLEKETELRLEVGDKNPVDIQLVQGCAEVFGTEMARNRIYSISLQSKIAIFTWHGNCKISIRGVPVVSYISDQTPMLIYLNAHIAIDQIRHKNELQHKIGSKVMLVGPTDVGKSTVCKMLCNFAVRMNREPCLVDIDVGQGSITIPGAVGLLPIVRPCDIETGCFSKKASLVYHYGYNNPGANLKLYNTAVTSLSDMFRERCGVNSKNRTGGCVINTCGWVDGLGYQAILHAAKAFEVDVVLVLDHERLYNDLQRELPPSTQIVPLPKSGGAVVRGQEYRRTSRNRSIREYFYGKEPHTLFPFSFDVSYAKIKIFKIGAPSVPESALPLGMKPEDGNTQVIEVEPSRDLIHAILSLSMATSPENDLASTPIAGFVCVTAVNTEKELLTILSPAPRPLPRKYLLLTNIKFMDLV